MIPNVQLQRFFLVVVATTLFSHNGQIANGQFQFSPGDTVVFLGDSNSYAGGYIDLLEAYFRLNQPRMSLRILNLALPSETVSGLSEPDHPFPRPDLRERLDRVLEQTKPQVVFVCYGINDGIYYPFNEGRFAAYRTGIESVVQRIKETGAKVILMTPFPFDSIPLRNSGALRDRDSKQFAYFAPYVDYDEVLQRYSEWITTRSESVELIVDLHAALNTFLVEQRKTDPEFTISTDGVHFNHDGHRVLAQAILRALGLPPELEFDEGYFRLVAERQHLLRDAWLTHCGHKRPDMPVGVPLDEAIRKAAEFEVKIRETAPLDRD